MRAYHLVAFLALGFWQVAPVQVTRSPGGRFRLAVAGATGQWEDYHSALVDCYGNETAPERSTTVGASSYGARADVFSIDRRRRLTLVAGNSTSDSSSVGQGFFWGAEVGLEWQKLGFSIGYRHAGDDLLPPDPYSSAGRENVSFSVRGGRLDRAHFRAEFRPLSETPSLAGEARVGLAFGQVGPGQASGFVGLVLGSLRSSDDDVPGAVFFDLGIPVAQTSDLLVRAVAGPGHLNPNWGLGAGLRVNWGR